MYQIQSIRLIPVALPLLNHFVTAQAQLVKRPLTLVEMTVWDTSANTMVTGYGEVQSFSTPNYASETQNSSLGAIEKWLGPHLLGKSIVSPQEFETQLEQKIPYYSFAKAGLALAFWDCIGKLKKQSLAQMLGGQSSTVAVGIAIGQQDTWTNTTEAVISAIEEGYSRIKLKISGQDWHLNELIELINHFPNQNFSLDANASLSWEQGIALQKLPQNVNFVEQPFANGDFIEHAHLQKKLTIPLSLDESVNQLTDVRTMIACHSAQLLTLKIGKIGGLLAAQKAIELLKQSQLQAWVGGMFTSGLGRSADLALASCLPNAYPADISDTNRYFQYDLIQEKLTVQQGNIAVPQKPGLGIRINWRNVSKAQCSSEIKINGT
ncbi:o-succinylbenzoate synthase [Convivina intestini]|uniref:o-succinylbenzoate synthase n=1 Tax=Convivina intestini TaxID=1505726 RepID=A0A2U1DET9_9LACO|nr:o-succinylbenzoate synthase [Convivina intestini]PVY86191.1 O-succinylbenzoate synthase [Convivina intestini]CAH1851380.1 o-succinylbenzoate synthase [Convivina intestini]CAH1852827.1 o-succinylbenzoate synthase [Convivina intestini]SDB81372.1 O-succinylbenzoate synthase [Leuconostocaceae bacterium R-53105]